MAQDLQDCVPVLVYRTCDDSDVDWNTHTFLENALTPTPPPTLQLSNSANSTRDRRPVALDIKQLLRRVRVIHLSSDLEIDSGVKSFETALESRDFASDIIFIKP